MKIEDLLNEPSGEEPPDSVFQNCSELRSSKHPEIVFAHALDHVPDVISREKT